MAYTDRIPFVIPAINKSDADAVFATMDPDFGGAGSFSVPLNATGAGNPTHWGSYGPVETGAYAALTGTNAALKAYLDSRPAKSGITPPSLGVVQSFKQTALLGAPGQNFWAFLTANGLKRVEPVI